MSRILRVQLKGEDATLGRVPAADVAKLLLATERVLARAAGEVLGRRVKPTGRWKRIIAEAVRLRLVAVESGSVTGLLELPDLSAESDRLAVDQPALFDVGTLSDRAVEAVQATLRDEGVSNHDTARALVRMADEVGVGTRYEAITFDTDAAPRPAWLDLQPAGGCSPSSSGCSCPRRETQWLACCSRPTSRVIPRVFAPRPDSGWR